MNLTSQLTRELSNYRESLNFNCKQWIDNKCKVFADYLNKNNLKGAVISVSGGIDSSVTYALCKETQKRYPDILKKVVPITQPINSSSWAINRSIELINYFGDKLTVIDQTDIFDSLSKLVKYQLSLNGDIYTDGQLKSYMRTPVNYYVAQLLNHSGTPSVVIGTGNKDEDGYLAYFCKVGDGSVDIQLISDLHKSQVFSVAKELNVPKSIIRAKPSADLWCGQDDETELGISYDFIELYTGLYLNLSDSGKIQFIDKLDSESKEQFDEFSCKAEHIHKRNKHKLKGVINL